MIYAFIVALGLNLLFGMLDAHHSANGISKGLFVEGNSMIVGIFGRRPTLKQLTIFNLTQCSVLCVFAVLDPFAPGDVVEHPLMMVSVAALVGDCLHHVKGYIVARRFGA